MKMGHQIVLIGITALLNGCASTPRTVAIAPLGPAPGEQATTARNGFLQVYSARERTVTDVNVEEFFWNNDFGNNEFLHRPAHTAYTIYTPNGQLVSRVRNARGMNDRVPTVVPLPPGTYKIEAEAEDYNDVTYSVTIPVVIQPGHTTVAHLERAWKPAQPYNGAEIVALPNGHIAGWRADSPADLQTGTDAHTGVQHAALLSPSK